MSSHDSIVLREIVASYYSRERVLEQSVVAALGTRDVNLHGGGRN